MITGFKSTRRYRHSFDGCTFDLYVTKVSYSNAVKSKLKIMYVSRLTGELTDRKVYNVEIQAEDYKNWSLAY